MPHRTPQELLPELRMYLQHFYETGHLGESETVAEIRRRLSQRIVEVEARVRANEANTGKTPDTKRTDSPSSSRCGNPMKGPRLK